MAFISSAKTTLISMLVDQTTSQLAIVRTGGGAKENQAAFAMLLARKETGIFAKYLAGTSRKTLMTNELFRPAFDKAKKRIARMAFRVVEEPDQIKQALLETYVAVALQTKHNSFATH